MIDSSPPYNRRCRRKPAAASSALGEAADQLKILVAEPTVTGEGHLIVAIEGNASEPPTAADQGPPGVGRAEEALSRRSARRAQVERFVQAVRDSDMAAADEAILRLSRSRRWLAPLALGLGAFAMLFAGVKLLFTNWRLTLIQVLPAMWIWAAMLDLKAHVLHGKTFHVLTGPIVIPLVLAVALITAASFYLNGVFAYAIAGTGSPQIRPAFTQAWSHRRITLASGFVVGVLLGLSTVVVTRWGRPWFGLSLSIVVGIMMICYVAVPARLIGMKTKYPKRDKLTATAVGGIVGAVVCTPPYLLGRLGLLMLGSSAFFIPGVIVLAIGLTLQAGATGAVKTVKMTAKLVPTRVRSHPLPGPDDPGR
jgi:hypothetical protein